VYGPGADGGALGGGVYGPGADGGELGGDGVYGPGADGGVSGSRAGGAACPPSTGKRAVL
jgi:hypothetical protein